MTAPETGGTTPGLNLLYAHLNRVIIDGDNDLRPDGRVMADKRIEARAYAREFGDDIPEVKDWKWTS